MTRTLYAWESDGVFFLSAFRTSRAHDGKRPAMEFDSRAGLTEEASRRGASVIWES